MNFDHRHYVPCLRWKQGEYQAILHLSNATKDFITPLIEVPEIGYDFEEEKEAKIVDDHLKNFAKRVGDKWSKRPCFVDVKLIDPAKRMADKQYPMAFIFNDLRLKGCLATPVTGLHRDSHCQTAVKEAVSKDGRGFCLRLSIEDAAKSNLENSVNTLLAEIGLHVEDCDLALDLGAPNFEPVEGFAKVIERIIRRIPCLSRWRTFTLIGTSFPKSMGGIKEGGAVIQRFEWLLYKTVTRGLAKAGLRRPTFGDYGISHPDVLPGDMRLLKPFATIRYTAEDSWFIVRGPNVRDKGFEQYRKHCRTVMLSKHYLGAEFSWGDKYIADCDRGAQGTGNLSTWRKVGTNHHLHKVVQDISNSFGSSGNP